MVTNSLVYMQTWEAPTNRTYKHGKPPLNIVKRFGKQGKRINHVFNYGKPPRQVSQLKTNYVFVKHLKRTPNCELAQHCC
ncbi:hypothetical protein HanPI659440_Chr06g0225441 [Helianthus annuus]|nr:hypothetical protein HanPI659440_Chr06g0225441 [Helianthus annuus]